MSHHRFLSWIRATFYLAYPGSAIRVSPHARRGEPAMLPCPESPACPSRGGHANRPGRRQPPTLHRAARRNRLERPASPAGMDRSAARRDRQETSRRAGRIAQGRPHRRDLLEHAVAQPRHRADGRGKSADRQESRRASRARTTATSRAGQTPSPNISAG